ncbi:hypothetical protein [Sebaldella sp. S0638]|uniref:hypothetical protein n=1 Tax=Sebaldella sp. S0638 TaxID=2957809 RepID=UPI0020A1A2C2|nr:hypothetical protein [Sebaldella sp. S0638]MCP1225933.1 hypothetical protein [Sebaldella sp. S0638]
MYSILGTVILAVVIILTRIIFGKSQKLVKMGTFQLVFLSIGGVILSILICAALGNRFYGLIILVTVFFAGLIQIHYVKRVERYNETGK